VNHPVSYWVPRHSPRVFVERVDVVTGIGADRARLAGRGASRHRLHRVVTDLAVLDFSAPDGTMSLVSTHPGVAVADVVAATGFELHLPAEVHTTRLPDPEELRIIRSVLDPQRLRDREVTTA
jgi:acyl CoA:acetate/3-ketoacid CoA transferase beta subunit